MTAIGPFVTQGHRFWYRLKARYDFLLANTLIYVLPRTVSELSRRIKLSLLTDRVPLYSCRIWGESLNSRLQNLAPKIYKHCTIVSYTKYFDRRTDGRTELR